MRLAVLFATLACLALPARAAPYRVDVVDETGNPLPTFSHRGRQYVLGTLGQRYLVRVRNDGARRVEAVVSVDGRDVLDGGAARVDKRGYLVDPGSEVTIDGFRISTESVAAFRFSSVPRSYAALQGDARDVGAIGVAVFAEREPPPVAVPRRELRSQEAPSAAPAPESAGAGRSADAAPRSRRDTTQRPGLGTEFGEEHDSHVRLVRFERASSRPDAVLTLRYDDREGLLALGIDVDGSRWARRGDAWLREHAEPFRGSGGFARPPPGWRPGR